MITFYWERNHLSWLNIVQGYWRLTINKLSNNWNFGIFNGIFDFWHKLKMCKFILSMQRIRFLFNYSILNLFNSHVSSWISLSIFRNSKFCLLMSFLRRTMILFFVATLRICFFRLVAWCERKRERFLSFGSSTWLLWIGNKLSQGNRQPFHVVVVVCYQFRWPAHVCSFVSIDVANVSLLRMVSQFHHTVVLLHD